MRFVNKETVFNKDVGAQEGPKDPKKVGDSFGPVLSSSLRQLIPNQRLLMTREDF